MSKEIQGPFTVAMNPSDSSFDHPGMARMILDKSYSGPLSGKSKGEMLSVRTEVESSAGYVAMERFSGELEGKNGSFVLQHFGMMTKNEQRLILEVVPDSGEGDLKGISGKMEINRGEKGHSYRFHYSL